MLFNDYSQGHHVNNKWNDLKNEFSDVSDTSDVIIYDFLARTQEIAEENNTPYMVCVLAPEDEVCEKRKAAVTIGGSFFVDDLLNAYEAITNLVFKSIAPEIGPVEAAMVLQSVLTKSVATNIAESSFREGEE